MRGCLQRTAMFLYTPRSECEEMMSVTLKSEGSAVAQAAAVPARHKYGPHTHTHTHTRTHTHIHAQFFLHCRHGYDLPPESAAPSVQSGHPSSFGVLALASSHRGRMSGIELLPGKDLEQLSLRRRDAR